jgi:two-component system CheB/CheR fusion protein
MSPTSEPLDILLDHLRRSRGFDFSGYKRPTLTRRIRKRMQDVGIDDFGAYLDHLEVHPDEITQLFNTILINVTAFFRDPAAWQYVAEEIVPQIISAKGGNEPIRVWSAGCASGEEPYTLAIIMSQALGEEGFRRRVKVYATDTDDDALNTARQARYSARDVDAVPVELRAKYFVNTAGQYLFKPELRRSIIFGRHDLVQHAPISRVDLLVCRNTLMYFNTEAQNRILSRFHFALKDDGFLFLGRAEMLLTHGGLFRSVDLTHRVFAKLAAATGRQMFVPPAPSAEEARRASAGNDALLREIAFDTGPVAQVMIDHNGTLSLANGQARRLFGLTLTDIGRPFHELELSYRPLELRSLIEQARTEHRTISIPDVERNLPGNVVQHLEVQVIPLVGAEGNPLGVSVLFNDMTQAVKLRVELLRVHSELETAYAELQSSNEELETTNEELHSTNEELETTNEELQSSNEELETMNEELQSSNEELQTLNDELRLRSEDLNEANAFLESIISGIRAAVVVVDTQMIVKAWSHRAEDLWGLRADEALRRSLSGLAIGLPLDQVRDLVRAVLDGGSTPGELVVSATNRRGKTIQCLVTATPHLGAGGQKQGAIVLMEEINPAHRC